MTLILLTGPLNAKPTQISLIVCIYWQATDADANPIITYIMTETNNDFTIDSEGNIRTKRRFDYETDANFYEFQVTTEEGRGLFDSASRATVRIDLLVSKLLY